MFNLLAAMNQVAENRKLGETEALLEKFDFGDRIILRSQNITGETMKYEFSPAPVGVLEDGPVTVYSFRALPKKAGVPYVELTFEITVGNRDPESQAEGPTRMSTSATPMWPSDAPEILELARHIVGTASSNEEKVAAILQWLAPGKNIQYSGSTGSRWGVQKVLEQGFGHCWDFSDCFVTLSRAVGVPSRQVAGWLYGGSGHVWAEYYREGLGWQQVDPTGGGELPCNLYHIPYFTTENGEMPILYVQVPRVEVIGTN
jgi:transglutaminase-like putative cysteine protease